jgi:hypothetical protein
VQGQASSAAARSASLQDFRNETPSRFAASAPGGCSAPHSVAILSTNSGSHTRMGLAPSSSAGCQGRPGEHERR